MYQYISCFKSGKCLIVFNLGALLNLYDQDNFLDTCLIVFNLGALLNLYGQENFLDTCLS